MNLKALNERELGGLYRDRAIRRFSDDNPDFFKKTNEQIFDVYYNKFLTIENFHTFGIEDVLTFLDKQKRHIYEHNTVCMPETWEKPTIEVERRCPLELNLTAFFDVDKLRIPQRIPLERVNTDTTMNNYLRNWADERDVSANLYAVLGSKDQKTSVAVYRIEQDFSNGTSLWRPVNLSEKNVYLIGSNSNVMDNILEIKEELFGNKGVNMYIVKNYVDLPENIPKKTNFEDRYSVNLEKVNLKITKF